jgi:hypothetical protein
MTDMLTIDEALDDLLWKLDADAENNEQIATYCATHGDRESATKYGNIAAALRYLVAVGQAASELRTL